MSIQYCHSCDQQIDTDFNLEHFEECGMDKHTEILTMIEGVNPADKSAMSNVREEIYEWFLAIGYDAPYGDYTRSRDALKAIRPEGWILTAVYYAPDSFKSHDDGSKGRITALSKPETFEEMDFVQFSSTIQHEELAELHAIIQAIAYDRGQQ